MTPIPDRTRECSAFKQVQRFQSMAGITERVSEIAARPFTTSLLLCAKKHYDILSKPSVLLEFRLVGDAQGARDNFLLHKAEAFLATCAIKCPARQATGMGYIISLRLF